MVRSARPCVFARVLSGYTFLGRPVDVIETSRGCTYDCSFCSIIEMRGRNFHTFAFERVLDDIRDAVAHGARALFIVDDNITLNVARFESLCRAIVEAGLHRVEYLVQGMTSSIANARDDARPAHARGRLPVRLPGHRERAGAGPRVPEGERQERGARARTPDGERDDRRDRRPPPERHVRRGGAHRRQPRRHARVGGGEPRVRAPLRGLAVHPAPHPVPRHPHDPRAARPRPHREREAGGVRRHHRGRAQRAACPRTRSSSCAGSGSAG